MGCLIDFYLPYQNQNGESVSSYDQAVAILEEAKKWIAKGYKGVAITYSANYDQTTAIHRTYKSGHWNTKTSGANQAEVMREMESLLGNVYSALQHHVLIAPITTMTYSNFGGNSHKDVVESDLKHIKSLLENEWIVLGWQNQHSRPDYAVGGGIATLPAEINNLIQSTLAQYAKNFPPQSD